MRGTITPLPNTPSWHGGHLKKSDDGEGGNNNNNNNNNNL